MKILLPYSTHFELVENAETNGKVITGGIEKFCQDLENNIDGIIPVAVTKEDKEKRRTRKVITDAIAEHDPDMILFNNPWWGNMMMSFNVPLICIMHEPLVRDIRMVELGTILRDLNENGCHIYFVSPKQYEYHKEMAVRIRNVDFGEIKGYINPSYLPEDTPFENTWNNEDICYDVSTVGRCDNEKAPFLVHSKLERSKLNSLVMTNDGVYKSSTVNDYVLNNQHWKDPRFTMRGLAHDDVMKNIAKSLSFCSTWPKESWGITAMEALGCGVPTLLMCDDTITHSSEGIAADPRHVYMIRRKCSSSDFESAILRHTKAMSPFRKEIAEMTKEKHSLTNWKKRLDMVIDIRYNDHNKSFSDLTRFL